MPARKSWMNLPEYQYVEDNPNPRFRPSFDKLISKLKDLSTLKHKPDATEELIGLLAHNKFVFEGEHPDHLLRLAVKMMDLWHLAMHTGHQFYYDYSAEAKELRQLESASLAPDKKIGEFSKDLFLENAKMKVAVRQIISAHVISLGDEYRELRCDGCNEEFATIKEWAIHLRREIWAELERYDGVNPAG